MASAKRVLVEEEEKGLVPAQAVSPSKYDLRHVFGTMQQEVNSLKVDFGLLIDNIHTWMDNEANVGGKSVLDNMSEFLISSFTTLLDTYIPPPARGAIHPTPSLDDIVVIKNTLKEKIKWALNHFSDLRDDAKYTDFCSQFLGKMSGKEARDILEALDPTSQCNAIVKRKTHCWICGLTLEGKGKDTAQCEHILPITDALLHLNLYQHRSSIEDLNQYHVDILKLEYLWAHACCNLTKNNIKYIKVDNDTYAIDPDGINKTIRLIKQNAGNKSHDCAAIFKKENDYTHLTLTRISKYIAPIVTTINLHIGHINKVRGSTNRAKAFLVYEYLIMIRFFCRLPSHVMVNAFIKYYLDPDAKTKQIAIDELQAQKAARAAASSAAAEARRTRAEAKAAELVAARERAEHDELLRATVAQEEKLEARNARAKRAAARLTIAFNATTRQTTAIEEQANKLTTENDPIALTETEVDALTHRTTVGGDPESAEHYAHVFTTFATERGDRLAARKQRIQSEQFVQRVRNLYDRTYESIKNSETDETDETHTDLALLNTIPSLVAAQLERLSALDRKIERPINTQLEHDKAIGENTNADADDAAAAATPKRSAAAAAAAAPKRGGGIDPYAIIQNDFTTEKAFIYLLAYYPAYLQKKNLRSISADQYMSTPHILRDTLKYFGIDPTDYRELLKNDGIAVSTPEKQDFAAFHAALAKQKRSAYQPVYSHESSPFAEAVFGGKRRTKKRRTNKHRANKRRTHKKN